MEFIVDNISSNDCAHCLDGTRQNKIMNIYLIAVFNYFLAVKDFIIHNTAFHGLTAVIKLVINV